MPGHIQKCTMLLRSDYLIFYCNFRQVNDPDMNQAPKHNNSASDDIDLLLLIERFLLFFKRYKWVFLISMILGLASGFVMYRFLPNIYRSRVVVHSFFLTNQENIEIIENWNSLLGKKEYAELSATLNCPENLFLRLKRSAQEKSKKYFLLLIQRLPG